MLGTILPVAHVTAQELPLVTLVLVAGFALGAAFGLGVWAGRRSMRS